MREPLDVFNGHVYEPVHVIKWRRQNLYRLMSVLFKHIPLDQDSHLCHHTSPGNDISFTFLPSFLFQGNDSLQQRI